MQIQQILQLPSVVKNDIKIIQQHMDFKTRFQGRTSTMNKNGVLGILQSTSQPIKKQFDSTNTQTNTNTIAQSYFFQKFQKNAETILQQQTDFDMTPSTLSGYPSHRFLQDLQKINLDQYEIVAIPKRVYDDPKYMLTQPIAPVLNTRMNNHPFQNDEISSLVKKTIPQENYPPKSKNLNLNQITNPFIQAGYGALRQKKLKFLTDRQLNTQLK
ncbi:unnamed protein product (macronuclear) [Paramecium tetraurelia]|uniref:Uncharacterized protein n=1 Tax=Paramecium tetraurelia TaxID=5888 RepID=A0EH02_PARTE|nr:uncharacterized protein GSPATT00026917001 [Paramecium tetraurelia]CAK94593.1 unnamed protein product [Paramecium tetraurelia]|eukprot:XP_001461966.1 hypothetical protein (macronuclear) [Paramecium tetraurelia strain d4-2]